MRWSSGVASGSPERTTLPGNCSKVRSGSFIAASVKSCRPIGGEIDLSLGGREAHGLRPDPVLAGRQRRKIVIAGLIGEDGGGDGAALRLGRYRDPAERRSARGLDGPAQ